jgi:hypothetical protein
VRTPPLNHVAQFALQVNPASGSPSRRPRSKGISVIVSGRGTGGGRGRGAGAPGPKDCSSPRSRDMVSCAPSVTGVACGGGCPVCVGCARRAVRFRLIRGGYGAGDAGV